MVLANYVYNQTKIDDAVNFVEQTSNRYSLLTQTEKDNLILEYLATNEIDPDTLLDVALRLNCRSFYNYQTAQESAMYRLATHALEKGANPNRMQVFRIIAYSSKLTLLCPEVVELLFNNSYKKISPESFGKYLKFLKKFLGFNDNLSDGVRLVDAAYKNLDVKSFFSPKIPRIIHHIWLTNEEQKREISKRDLENVFQTHDLFLKNKKGWRQIVWTNNLSLIPESVKLLKENHIEVKDISELLKYFKLGEKIAELIKKGYWGMASDSLRYELVNYFGGVYTDLNYVFIRDLEEEIYKYDYLGHNINYHSFSQENSFFAAKPNHPILTGTIDIVYNNFYDPQHIEYISTQRHSGSTVTDETTYVPFCVAYFANANNSTTDVIYPYFNPEKIGVVESGTKDVSVEQGSSELYEQFIRENAKQILHIIKKFVNQNTDVLKMTLMNNACLIDNKGFCSAEQRFLIGFDQDGESQYSWGK